MVGARLAAVGNRYLLGAIVLLSTSLIWWSVMVRLSGASAGEVAEQRNRNIEFTLNSLGWQRDSIAADLESGGWAAVEAQLVADPGGLVALLDEVRAVSADAGIAFRYAVSDRVTLAFDPQLGYREVELRADGMQYEQLLRALDGMEALARRRLLLVSAIDLEQRDQRGSLKGAIVLKVWTRQNRGGDVTDFLEF